MGPHFHYQWGGAGVGTWPLCAHTISCPHALLIVSSQLSELTVGGSELEPARASISWVSNMGKGLNISYMKGEEQYLPQKVAWRMKLVNTWEECSEQCLARGKLSK